MKATPDEIRERFERIADALSDLERGQEAIPDAPVALDLVARAAAAVTPHGRSLLDVGCGAGNYALKLLEHVGDADVTLLDLSATLLARASERVGAATRGQVATVQGDIRDVTLPEEAFDVAVAGAVLHHLREAEEWRDVFAKLFRTLRPGGSLWISDLVQHDLEAVDDLMRERYGEYLVAWGGKEARAAVFREIDRQDTPRSLAFQTGLLLEVGFTGVEVLHKNTCFATFGALKPSG